MSKPFSEFTNLPQPFQPQERLAFTDLAPADADRYATEFLELRQATWQEVVPDEVISVEQIEALYAPTESNILAQQRYIRAADPRTHYVAATKNRGDFSGLVALGKVRSHFPESIGGLPVSVEVSAFDTLPKYQTSGVGSLMLHELLDFYKTPDTMRERGVSVSVPKEDEFLLGWLERRELRPVGKPKGDKIVCVGGVMTVRQALSEKLARLGMVGHQRKFYLPVTSGIAGQDA